MNLRTIRTLNSWPLRIEPAHSRVWEGACLLWRNPIDWLRTSYGRNAAERRKLKSVLRGCRAMYILQGAAIIKASQLQHPLGSLPVSAIAVRVADIHTYIRIYIYIAKSRIEHNHWLRFARSRSPLGNYFTANWQHLHYFHHGNS